MKAGFISLTKTGHSSISQMLPHINNFSNFDADWLKVGKHKWLKDEGDISTSGQLNRYDILFSSVRNPVDRFVSSYKECCKNYGYKGLITEFLKDYKNDDLTDMQMWHTQAQSFHLIPDELDFIVKIENFNEDMKELYEILGIDKKPEPLWVNKSTEPQIELPSFFKKQVEQEFCQCMGTFNY